MALEKSDSGTSPSIGLMYATQCYIHLLFYELCCLHSHAISVSLDISKLYNWRENWADKSGSCWWQVFLSKKKKRFPTVYWNNASTLLSTLLSMNQHQRRTISSHHHIQTQKMASFGITSFIWGQYMWCYNYTTWYTISTTPSPLMKNKRQALPQNPHFS